MLTIPAFLTLNCGGDNSASRPSPTPPPELGLDPFDCSAGDGYEYRLLQDFERGVATDFYTNSDGSKGSSTEPPAGSKSPPSADIEGGRCGVSTRAFRMTGSDLRTWGMVFGMNFRDGARDLSDWEGISFWARKGKNSGSSLFFSVFDPNTVNPPSGIGNCNSDSEVLTEKCDAYGTGFGLAEDWRYFAISFDQLRQRGFGVPTEELRIDQIVGLNWSADIGDWDVWIDDIALFRTPDPGAGGAGGGGGAGGAND